jgi:hypothetical protein
VHYILHVSAYYYQSSVLILLHTMYVSSRRMARRNPSKDAQPKCAKANLKSPASQLLVLSLLVQKYLLTGTKVQITAKAPRLDCRSCLYWYKSTCLLVQKYKYCQSPASRLQVLSLLVQKYLLTGTKVQILPKPRVSTAGPVFTGTKVLAYCCFTGTKVHILTLLHRRRSADRHRFAKREARRSLRF